MTESMCDMNSSKSKLDVHSSQNFRARQSRFCNICPGFLLKTKTFQDFPRFSKCSVIIKVSQVPEKENKTNMV